MGRAIASDRTALLPREENDAAWRRRRRVGATSYTRGMRWWLEDETDFAGVGAALAVAATVLALVGTEPEAGPLLLLAGAIVTARGWWRTMPPVLLILGPAVPVFITEARSVADSGWMIVCVGLLVAAAGPISRWEWAAIALVISGPFWLWAAQVEDYLDFGPWTWVMGLGLSAAFGAVLGRQRVLIAKLEAQQRQLVEAASAEERRRIARELHDLVGHSFSVVMMHLSGARRLLGSDPERAGLALADAEEVGRRSMDDLRSALWMLRSDDESIDPVRGVDALLVLADEFRAAGLDVTCEIAGDLSTLDAATSVVLYSVGREALTNAAKHASPGAVSMRLDATDSSVLTVTNPATEPKTAAGAVPSQGVLGMTERVRAVGGTLAAGYDHGTWQVVAIVPARAVASPA